MLAFPYARQTPPRLRAFQAANNLKVDGICGSETLMVLFAY